MITYFESFNTWVNWQQNGAGPTGELKTISPLNLDDSDLGIQTACVDFMEMGGIIAAYGSIIGNPILQGIGAYLFLEGAICDAGGYLTFGTDGGFVD